MAHARAVAAVLALVAVAGRAQAGEGGAGPVLRRTAPDGTTALWLPPEPLPASLQADGGDGNATATAPPLGFRAAAEELAVSSSFPLTLAPYRAIVWGVGAGTNCAMYARLFRALARAGIAAACPNSANPQALVRAVRGLRADGFADRVALGGHSYGGNTAQVAASMLGQGTEVLAVGNFPGGLCPLGVFGCNAHGLRVPTLLASPSSDVNQIGVKENVFELIPADTAKVWVSLAPRVGHNDIMRGDTTIALLAVDWYKWILAENSTSAADIWGGQIRDWKDVIDVDIRINAERLLNSNEASSQPGAAFAALSARSVASGEDGDGNTTTTTTTTDVLDRALKLAAEAFLKV